jgi:hypothetical protein
VDVLELYQVERLVVYDDFFVCESGVEDVVSGRPLHNFAYAVANSSQSGRYNDPVTGDFVGSVRKDEPVKCLCFFSGALDE